MEEKFIGLQQQPTTTHFSQPFVHSFSWLVACPTVSQSVVQSILVDFSRLVGWSFGQSLGLVVTIYLRDTRIVLCGQLLLAAIRQFASSVSHPPLFCLPFVAKKLTAMKTSPESILKRANLCCRLHQFYCCANSQTAADDRCALAFFIHCFGIDDGPKHGHAFEMPKSIIYALAFGKERNGFYTRARFHANDDIHVVRNLSVLVREMAGRCHP